MSDRARPNQLERLTGRRSDMVCARTGRWLGQSRALYRPPRSGLCSLDLACFFALPSFVFAFQFFGREAAASQFDEGARTFSQNRGPLVEYFQRNIGMHPKLCQGVPVGHREKQILNAVIMLLREEALERCKGTLKPKQMFRNALLRFGFECFTCRRSSKSLPPSCFMADTL